MRSVALRRESIYSELTSQSARCPCKGKDYYQLSELPVSYMCIYVCTVESRSACVSGVRSRPYRTVNRALTLVTDISPLNYGASVRACRSGKRPHLAYLPGLRASIDFRALRVMCRDLYINNKFKSSVN